MDGKVKSVFFTYYEDTKRTQTKGVILGNDNNEYHFKKYVNDDALMVRDIVSFNIIQESKEITDLKFKEAPVIELDNEDVIKKIKEANYYLSIIQMRNPRIEDKKGYSNDKFTLGLELEQMWNNEIFSKDNKNLLLQVTASLLVNHLTQSKKISSLLNEKYFNDILPFYKKLKEGKVLSSIRKRSTILKNSFQKYTQNIKDFYCNYIEDDNQNSSLIIYSYNKENINEIIVGCNLLTFSNDTNIKTENHCYLAEKTVDNKKIHIIEINDFVIDNNLSLRNYILELKSFFVNEDQFINLTSRFNNSLTKDSLTTKKQFNKLGNI